MSYIFNNFSTPQPGGPSFSSVVKIAREKGYTVRLLSFPPSLHPSPHVHISNAETDTRHLRPAQEPHPADDLTGSDVSRKLTILTPYIPSLTLFPPTSPSPPPYSSSRRTPFVSYPALLHDASADEYVIPGNILVRQRGSVFHPGQHVRLLSPTSSFVRAPRSRWDRPHR